MVPVQIVYQDSVVALKNDTFSVNMIVKTTIPIRTQCLSSSHIYTKQTNTFI